MRMKFAAWWNPGGSAKGCRETTIVLQSLDLGYSAAHALALAALRIQGLGHPTAIRCLTAWFTQHCYRPPRVRLLGEWHRRRNIAEYEGGLDVDGPFVQITAVSARQLEKVEQLLQDVQT